MRNAVPVPMRRPLGLIRAVLRRLSIWGKVTRRMTGTSVKDRKTLRRAILHAPITVFHDLQHWQFPMVDEDCSVVSHQVGTFEVRAHTDDLFHVLPGQEPAVETAIRMRLKPGDTFVDAGANIGFYTVLASPLVGDRGCVFSFEMVPITAEILRKHVDKNGLRNVNVIEGALSNSAGEKVLAALAEGKSGQSSIVSSRGETSIQVTTIILADELKDVPFIHLIKMDLEGAELGALKGMGRDLRKVGAIIFENRGAEDVVEYLEEQGFDVTRLDGNNALAEKVNRLP